MIDSNQKLAQDVSQNPVEVIGGSEPPNIQSVEEYPFAFHGKGIDLAILILKNLILTVLTVGVYSFWGKVEVRKFIWANTDFFGGRFRYHGTGKELFLGFLKVAGIYLVFIGVVSLTKMISAEAAGIVTAVLTLGIYFVIPAAIYMSRRYLLSRTSWRGVHFGMDRGAKDFVFHFVGGAILSGLTMGFYTPVFLNRNYRFLMERSYFGSAKIRYTGEDSDAFMLFLKYLPLMIITVGLAWFAYRAAVMRFHTENTWIGNESFGAARGQMNMTGFDYFKLVFLNLILIICTLGLALPWVMAHNMSFFLSRLSFIGNIEFEKVHQVEVSGDAVGDGLADALDLGFV